MWDVWPGMASTSILFDTINNKKGDYKCETCVHQVIGGVVCLTFHFF